MRFTKVEVFLNPRGVIHECGCLCQEVGGLAIGALRSIGEALQQSQIRDWEGPTITYLASIFSNPDRSPEGVMEVRDVVNELLGDGAVPVDGDSVDLGGILIGVI